MDGENGGEATAGILQNLLGVLMQDPIGLTVRQGLYTHIVGQRVLYFNELESTMDEAARLASEGAGEGIVVMAERQTAGRGRQGRTWVSEPGNLLLSILFRPSLEQLPYISMIGGIATARAISKTSGMAATIKWPNDVKLRGLKVSGILAESAIVGDSVCYAVLGLGINVTLDVAGSGDISGIATSVNSIAEREVGREELLRQLLLELDDLYVRLGRHELPIDEWSSLLETTGRRVTANSGKESYTGLAEGVDHAGNLLLRLDSGQLITLTSGDVTLRNDDSS